MNSLYHKLRARFENLNLSWARNRPFAWALGWHTQLLITAFTYVLTLLISLALPVSFRSTPDVEFCITIAFILAIFWWIYIVYRLVKHNPEKLFGNRKFGYNFLEIPGYAVQLALPIGIPLILSMVLTWRISMTVDDAFFVKMGNDHARAHAFFEMPTLYAKPNPDAVNHSDFYFSEDDYYYDEYSDWRYFPDDKEAQKYLERLEDHERQKRKYEQLDYRNFNDLEPQYRYDWVVMTDSIKHHKGVFKDERPKLYHWNFSSFGHLQARKLPSPYDGLPIPSYSMLKDFARSGEVRYYLRHFRDHKYVFTEFQNMFENMEKSGINSQAQTQYFELVKGLYKNHEYSVFEEKDPLRYRSLLQLQDDIYLFERQMGEVADAKDWDIIFTDSRFYTVLFFLLFSAAIVLGLFKALHWKEFLVGVLLIVVTMIAFGISVALVEAAGSAETFAFVLSWLLISLFLGFSIAEKNHPKRRKRGAFVMMVVQLLVPILPIFLLATIDEMFGFWTSSLWDGYIYIDPETMLKDYTWQYYRIKDAAPLFCGFLGFGLFILLWYPLVRKPNWIRFMAKPFKS